MRTASQLHLADLAQLVEHLICNQRVSGSNPLIGMGYFYPQVHLVMTYHPRGWEDMSSRCSLVVDTTGASED